ncbi:MAG: hypothetical protein ACFFC9_16005, partial [Promethearchaeota archaeon]
MKKQILIVLTLVLIPIVSLSLLEHHDYLKLTDSSINSLNLNYNKESALLDSDSSISLSYTAQDYVGLTEELWENNLTGKGITVAVLDTGIYPNHSVFTYNGLNNWTERI